MGGIRFSIKKTAMRYTHFSVLFILFFYQTSTSAQTVQLYYPDTVFTAPNTTIEIDLKVNSFQSMAGFQFTLTWDQTNLTLLSIEQPTLTITPSTTLNTLQVAWADITGLGQTLPDSSTLIRLHFQASNDQPISTSIDFASAPLATEFYQLTGQDIVAVPTQTTSCIVFIRTCQVAVDLADSTSFCAGGALLVRAICTDCQLITWPDNTHADSVITNQTGWLNVQASGDLRCYASDSIWISETALPEVDLSPNRLICSIDTIVLTPEGLGNYSYLWSTGDTSINIVVAAGGIYTLTVTNQEGCTKMVTTTVQQNLSPTTSFMVTQPSCSLPVGSIFFTNFQGLHAPYLYSFDGGSSYSENNQLNSAVPDIYTPVVEDSDGCVFYFDLLEIKAPYFPEIKTITKIIDCFEGDSVMLEAFLPAGYPLALVSSINWHPSDSVYFDNNSLDARLKPTIYPATSGYYKVTVSTTDGCTDSDSVFIRIVSNGQIDIYVPNVITPGSDNNNRLVAFCNDTRVEQIHKFSIFDRWGNLVFAQDQVLFNDLLSGWDGQIRNKPADLGVYIWVLDTRLKDGLPLIRSGSVTVIR